VAFAPHGRADRDHLADHRLGRELSAGNDWLDVIESRYDRAPELFLMRSMARISAAALLLRLTTSRPTHTVVSGHIAKEAESGNRRDTRHTWTVSKVVTRASSP